MVASLSGHWVVCQDGRTVPPGWTLTLAFVSPQARVASHGKASGEVSLCELHWLSVTLWNRVHGKASGEDWPTEALPPGFSKKPQEARDPAKLHKFFFLSNALNSCPISVLIWR